MFISGKVCLLGSIKVRRQTLPEINMHTLEYCIKWFNMQVFIYKKKIMKKKFYIQIHIWPTKFSFKGF